jgi:SagB-type dehydrogenase family enzyme
MADATARIRAYHQASKHRFDAYARGPEFLDWDEQPAAFREFSGAPRLALDHLPPPVGDEEFFSARAPAPLNRASVSQLFYDSLALSAWKQAGAAKWALRVNPSSGNLHPTEAYLLSGPIPGLSDSAGVYHYAPQAHALECRAQMPPALWQRFSQDAPVIFIGLSSIHWREAWKYGERAFRYCQHDIGHALGALQLAASLLGWQVALCDELSSEDLTTILGLRDLGQSPEGEYADCLVAISAQPGCPARAVCAEFADLDWHGQANRLSPEHVRWPALEQAAQVCKKAPGTPSYPAWQSLPLPQFAHLPPSAGARTLVRRRRSAVAMDGRSDLAEAIFYRILAALLPGQRFFSLFPWPPQVDLFFFVPRVTGLRPGFYALIRDPARLPVWQAHSRTDWLWRTSGSPGLGLYFLADGDMREIAGLLSCRQNIAVQGCFSVAMLACFDAPLTTYGAWFYPRLFWECGALGQVLYLQAEAANLAGTGIGCFFDDPVHELIGLTDETWQSLYHFTVGGRVEDLRLQTLPAYP